MFVNSKFINSKYTLLKMYTIALKSNESNLHMYMFNKSWNICLNKKKNWGKD